MERALLHPSSAAWAEALLRIRHDFYHLPEYASFASEHQDGGDPRAFFAREGDATFLVPLLVRPIDVDGERTEWFDAASPRGYPGPVLSSGGMATDARFLTRALESLAETLREASIVAAYLRLHPLLSPTSDQLHGHGVVVHHGESISIDLSLSEQELWHQTRDDHRQGIRKAERRGLTASIDDQWMHYDEFVEIYSASMRRVGATSFWQLPREYFDGLRAALRERLHLAVVRDGQQVAAAGLLSEVDGTVEYHLAGTADAYLRASPSKLLIHFARGWARERGNRALHLGGSLRSGDALSQFKAGFSPRRHDVLSWRVVADEDAYAALVAAWERGNHRAADPRDGFFPAFRRPAPDVDDEPPGGTPAAES